ncbi:ABC transporter permease [Streptococcus downei]|uniref:ABC transporter permease n=1 Tax=Streptococcus downei MFe28 TaxID=764290 RepID=A0A380JDV5_STRDO|nr:ABC transporter permease [Streptococcus downei]SUN36259.1 ABC transporter permease [Streptococcus downei MFe28]
MQNWKFALGSIMGHKMRSFLTMLGVIIGVASVSFVLALGNGFKVKMADTISKAQHDVQVYYVSSSGSTEDENEALASGQMPKGAPKVQEAWLETIVKNVDGISGYYITNTTTANVASTKKKVKQVTLTGVSQSYFKVRSLKILAGRRLEESDYTQLSRYTMIDRKLADKLFSSYDEALNQIVEIGGKQFRVVGVYKDPNEADTSYSMASGNAIFTNSMLASEFNLDEISAIYVHVPDVDKSLDSGRAAAKELTKLSGASSGKFKTYDLTEAIAQYKAQVSGISLFIGLIGATTLIVGGIGVMNIMLVSVTERTREIGLRKALGATRSNILMQFLIESVLLTLIGGAIGLLLARGIVGLLAKSEGLLAQLGRPSISFGTILISLFFSVLVGIVFGILPANKASKLDPIEALRYE